MNNRIIMNMKSAMTWNMQMAISACCALAFLLSPQVLFAAFPVALTPAVIDGEAKAREILRYKVTITNDTDHMLSLYPWARDIDELGEDAQSRGLDPTESLLSWLEFSRAVLDVPAGTSVELPVLVQVNLRARPGMYHAVLHVSDGPNRTAAELDSARTSSLMINIRVLDDANERLQLGVFATDKNLFMGDSATFGFRLDNTGNRGVTPTGKIRIFDRRGEEVDVVDINATNDKIEPERNQQLASVWQSGSHFGKYKALLDVSYGKTGTIQDTVFFWVLPWKKLLSFFFTLAIFSVMLALFMHSYTASGGKKLALVRERISVRERSAPQKEEEDEGGLRDYGEQLRARMSGAWKWGMDALPDAFGTKSISYVDNITEVPPPTPQRTRYSVSDAPTSDRVHLLPRKGKERIIDPAHIVHLKK